MTSQQAANKMADMRYYDNVMTTTRWRLYVTMETLWQQQDGGYAYHVINLLKPKDIYICRTAALTSRRYILNIYSTNIDSEYFKHAT